MEFLPWYGVTTLSAALIRMSLLTTGRPRAIWVGRMKTETFMDNDDYHSLSCAPCGYSAKWILSASSRSLSSLGETQPMRRNRRCVAIDLTCSACAFESTARPLVAADNNT